MIYVATAYFVDNPEEIVIAVSITSEGARIALRAILHEDAKEAHDAEPISDELLDEFIEQETVINEPIELPLHNAKGELK